MPTGVVGNDTSTSPSISGDGTRVAFQSNATNLSGVDSLGDRMSTSGT